MALLYPAGYILSITVLGDAAKRGVALSCATFLPACGKEELFL
jgi:hypothetical protein